MFRQVTVGVDGRDGGRDAIALARRLVERDGELTLCHVYTGEPHLYGGAREADYDFQRQQALGLIERARKEAGVQAHMRWCGFPPVGGRLHELCGAIGADLLVVGSSRRGLLGRVLAGDDTRGAINGAPCAVAIAPAGYSREPVVVREIGVGYNGSAQSQRALGLARALALELGAKLSAFEAVTVPSTALSTGPLPFEQMVGSLVAEARGRIAALGDVEPHAAYGEAADELALYSASLDLLVVGSRGYRLIERLLHGTTSHQLARSARCPLLVLPPTTPHAPEVADDRGRANRRA